MVELKPHRAQPLVLPVRIVKPIRTQVIKVVLHGIVIVRKPDVILCRQPLMRPALQANGIVLLMLGPIRRQGIFADIVGNRKARIEI